MAASLHPAGCTTTLARLHFTVLVFAALYVPNNQGKLLRCACSTQHCRDMKSDTCTTEYKCYTQYLNKRDGSNPVSFGCISGNTPLLCENRMPAVVNTAWPYLQCCDAQDFCNNGELLDPPLWAQRRLQLPKARNGTEKEKKEPQIAEAGEGWSSRRSYALFYPLNQPLVVSVLFVGMFLMIGIMAFGFYLLYQQSRYLKRACIRRGYVRAEDELSSSLVGTPEPVEPHVTVVATTSARPKEATSVFSKR